MSASVDEGRAALRAGDLATARAAAERALEGGDPGAAHELLAEVLYLEHAYRPAAGEFERAYAAYRRAHDQGGAGRAARAVAWVNGGVLGEWAVQSGWLARASTILEEAGGNGAERAWVLILRSFSAADPQARAALLREALGIGRRVRDPDVEFEALGYLGALQVLTGQVDAGLRLLDESMAAACAGEMTEISAVDSLFCGFFWACELVNDVPRADQWMRVAADGLLRERNVVAAFCRAHYGGILTAAGRWDEAEAELLGAVGHFDAGLSERRAAAVIRLADLRVRQGRLEEATELLRGLDQHPDAVRTLATLHLAREQHALARDLLERATAGADDDVPSAGESTMIAPLLALLVEVCLGEGDASGAEQATGRLRHLSAAQNGSYLRAAASLAEGRLHAAGGDARARGCLQDAVAEFSRARLPMDAAVARLELARVCAGAAPEVAVATALEALAVFDQLSATQYADAAGALLRNLGAPVRTGPKGVGALTRRELEVLRLLAAGLSNPEIAARLYITRKTVEHHVGNVLAKLGLRNRAEAAAFAARETAMDTRGLAPR